MQQCERGGRALRCVTVLCRLVEIGTMVYAAMLMLWLLNTAIEPCLHEPLRDQLTALLAGEANFNTPHRHDDNGETYTDAVPLHSKLLGVSECGSDEHDPEPLPEKIPVSAIQREQATTLSGHHNEDDAQKETERPGNLLRDVLVNAGAAHDQASNRVPNIVKYDDDGFAVRNDATPHQAESVTAMPTEVVLQHPSEIDENRTVHADAETIEHSPVAETAVPVEVGGEGRAGKESGERHPGEEKEEARRKTDDTATLEQELASAGGAGADADKDMPSFDEWKQKMLADKLTKEEARAEEPTPAKLKSSPMHNNYASVDCGAKVLDTNQEAQASSSILIENRDQYMLNPCRAHIWFVVELCDPIQLKLLEMANYELFSSLPEKFQVYTSDRYPTRDWHNVGVFTGKDVRNLQAFPTDEQVFAKYIKIEMLSHFGSEHYCPLSILRVYGVTMFGEYEDTEAGSVAGAPGDQTGIDTGGLASDALDSDLMNDSGPDLLQAGKGLVQKLINKVVHVFNADSGYNRTEDLSSIQQKNISNNGTVADTRLLNVIVMRNDSDGEILCVDQMTNMYDACTMCSTYVDGSTTTETGTRTTCGFLKTLDLALHHRCRPGISCRFPRKPPRRGATYSGADDTEIRTGSGKAVAVETETQAAGSADSGGSSAIHAASENGRSTTEVPATETQDARPGDSNLASTPHVTTSPTATTLAASSAREVTVDGGRKDEGGGAAADRAPVIDADVPHVASNESGSVPTAAHHIATIDATKHDEPAGNATAPAVTDEAKGAPTGFGAGYPNGESNGALTNAKESVIMRLSNRIKTLELNMSLSSEYLETLSQRYRKQMEQMQKAFNTTTTALLNTSRKAEERDLRQQEAIAVLQGQLDELTKVVTSLVDERQSLHQQVIERHLFLMGVEIIVMSLLMSFCLRWQRHRANAMPAQKRHQVARNSTTRRHSATMACSTPSRQTLKRQSSDNTLNLSGQGYEDLMIIEPFVQEADDQNAPGGLKKRKRRNKSKKKSQSSQNLHEATGGAAVTGGLRRSSMSSASSGSSGGGMNSAGLLFGTQHTAREPRVQVIYERMKDDAAAPSARASNHAMQNGIVASHAGGGRHTKKQQQQRIMDDVKPSRATNACRFRFL
ncbi:PREDICTED: SUN domain-containing ossification factor-like isoform X2 [Priapulus caudatus]|uniref:SUN domain-containing ossification factor-like isoform X2 n=1 Tax=Priapulus caudatus TaxID=37621 RepID=A0ABM1F9W6_PRICU|nr:PREDICTED: SUN domain-containing ossification factor-like isoform X2 [Priapulus caudatus]XP_014681238.1 PREDICTED: SUN domain-containing ossification factor-like isoform X2 [Priapulus caudatus]